jgi:hypothetical protein
MGFQLMAASGQRIMVEQEIKQQVKDFYNQVGWQEVSEGVYQNARYEDLRPVSRDYIHRCHLRVLRHLKPEGKLLLDGGSGPIQYPEYLEYSRRYQYRVCADISSLALREARKRIGKHGLFVVCDIANLPFRAEIFEGAVSLHTIHHLPLNEQVRAYREINRVLCPDSTAIVVNGWPESSFMKRWEMPVALMERLKGWAVRVKRGKLTKPAAENSGQSGPPAQKAGTYTERLDLEGLRHYLQDLKFDIYVWRSVSVRFLRAIIHPFLAGKLWLRLLFWLEERRPEHFGIIGQYPLIVLRKSNNMDELKSNMRR